MKPNIQAGCEHCTLVTNHATKSSAVQALRAHTTEWPDHSPLVSTPRDGWHRVWLEEEA